MQIPELLFGYILLLALIAFGYWYKQYRQSENIGSLIAHISVVFAVVIFCFIWFVPLHVGWNNETPVAKFRFQVFEISSDDYGSIPGVWNNIFVYTPDRYGAMYLHKRIGGIEMYFMPYTTPEGYTDYPGY